jgi:DNA-binding CsgD family transcriptional regulator
MSAGHPRIVMGQNGCVAPLGTSTRLRGDLVDVLHRAGDLREFSRRAARIVRRSVPFDGVCLVTLDPATALPTSELTENGLPAEALPRMARIEVDGKDVNTFREMLRSGHHVATLSEATRGELDLSVRHRELRSPNGFGDELRSVLASDGAVWGGFTLLRGEDHARFTPEEAELVASLSRHLAEGVRRTVLLTALSARPADDAGQAGLVLLADDDSVVSTDSAGAAWLTELTDGGRSGYVTGPIAAVASRARAAHRDRLLARARVPLPSGAWVVIRASLLAGDDEPKTAVTIEPARTHDLAPLVADAYQFTERERAVTQLVAQGLATAAISRRLQISTWTVQDHLKSIFEKVGVNTRGELVARLFFDHYAPRLSAAIPPGSDGWFDLDHPQADSTGA